MLKVFTRRERGATSGSCHEKSPRATHSYTHTHTQVVKGKKKILFFSNQHIHTHTHTINDKRIEKNKETCRPPSLCWQRTPISGKMVAHTHLHTPIVSIFYVRRWGWGGGEKKLSNYEHCLFWPYDLVCEWETERERAGRFLCGRLRGAHTHTPHTLHTHDLVDVFSTSRNIRSFVLKLFFFFFLLFYNYAFLFFFFSFVWPFLNNLTLILRYSSMALNDESVSFTKTSDLFSLERPCAERPYWTPSARTAIFPLNPF